MAYATVADFELAFGLQEAIDLTNLENPAANMVDEEILEAAIADASAEIDSYLRKAGYTLPLTQIPPVLKGRCLDIARYKLDLNNTREVVRDRYKDAINWLKDLVRGIVDLGISTNDGIGGAESGMPSFYGSDRTFTRDSLIDY